jgi:hypothetical protein
MADDAAAAPGRTFPRVPGYAWTWFQRSRPVVVEAAERLTGTAPGPGFVDDLRVAFEQDPFTRDIVIGVVADIAFGGRAPGQRPPGASWDRGLTWWAAALAGATPAEFESRAGAPVASQHRLFDAGGDDREPDPQGLQAAARRRLGPRLARSPERAALAAALRELLAASEADQVPAAAVRQLLAQLEGDETP